MPYLLELVEKIRDRDKWPYFDRGHFLAELNTVADDAYAKGTVEGYLAALLVYHQLIEESLRLVLRWNEFFMQLQLAPLEFHIAVPKKAMFGHFIEELRKTVEFAGKAKLIALAEKTNSMRIGLVHGLTKHTSIDEIAADAKAIKQHFDEYFEQFQEVEEWFMLVFKDLRKDVEWDEMFEEE